MVTNLRSSGTVHRVGVNAAPLVHQRRVDHEVVVPVEIEKVLHVRPPPVVT